MLPNTSRDDLTYPFAEPPVPGEVKAVAPGILWVRIPLPFRLNHVNVYLMEDGDGWAILDTGIGNDETRATWEVLVRGPLRGRRLTRLIVTHFHPDHIGLAGWLCERFDLPLLTSQTSYLGCLHISLSPGALDAQPYRDVYLQHGLSPDVTAQVATRGHDYLKMVHNLPPVFMRLVDGDTIVIGDRTFSVLTGDGHAPEQVMLYCAKEQLFLAADQVLAKITPNVSVWAVDPDGDPLGLYLRSLGELKAALPDCQSAPNIDPVSASNFGSDSILMKFQIRVARSSEESVPCNKHFADRTSYRPGLLWRVLSAKRTGLSSRCVPFGASAYARRAGRSLDASTAATTVALATCRCRVEPSSLW